MGKFTDGQHFVLVSSPHQIESGLSVRCLPRKIANVYECIGAQVLLHATRHEDGKGYFGIATVADFEPAPDRRWVFILLSRVELFLQSVPTYQNGTPRENAPTDEVGKPAFSFYSNGLRPISKGQFDEIVETAGAGRQQYTRGFDDPLRENDVIVDQPMGERSRLEIAFKQEPRRVRARLKSQLIRAKGAFCCMSGASFDVPQGFSLLQVSHFWPLGHGGPDVLTNVGLMTPNIHPIYENGLVCIRPDYSFWFAPDIPPGFVEEFRGRRQLSLSGDARIDPAEANLAYHREEIFLRRLRRLGLSLAN